MVFLSCFISAATTATTPEQSLHEKKNHLTQHKLVARIYFYFFKNPECLLISLSTLAGGRWLTSKALTSVFLSMTYLGPPTPPSDDRSSTSNGQSYPEALCVGSGGEYKVC